MLRRLTEDTYFLPGSPSTLFVKGGGGYWVVDPGYPLERAEEIRSAAGRIEGVILTHFHSDHVYAAKVLRARKYAPMVDVGPILNARMRLSMTLGGCCAQRLLWLKAEDVPVEEAIAPPCKLGPGRVVPLPGHTFGQVGYLTDSGVLYMADAAFGERLLKRVKIPYHLDYSSALGTLYRLREEVAEFTYIVPGHGPVVRRNRALSLLEKNIDALEMLPKMVKEMLKSGPMTAESIAAKIVGSEETSSILLGSVTVRSVLYHLYERSEVETTGVAWKL